MKNTLMDLNNYLFESLERINDDSLDEEQLERELKKAKATANVSKTIIDNASIVLEAAKYKYEYNANNIENLIGTNTKTIIKNGK